MKTQYYGASSLDGFIADENHSLDWLLSLGSTDDTSYPDFIVEVGALAMGSSTYEWLLRELVHADPNQPQPWPYEQPTWVFTTRTLPTVPGADIRFVQGDVAPFHAQMADAADGKNVWIVGGGDLAGQFYDAGLLDELIIQIAPVTLGKGMPLFPRRIASPPMRLLSTQVYGVFVEVRYSIGH